MKTRWYWGTKVNGWRVWGVWICQQWFVGFSVVAELEGK